MSVVYFVDKMRVIRPSGKTAERNPERVYTVNGIFYSTEVSPEGKVTVKDKLSIITKNVDREDIFHPDFALDVKNGLLALPEGKRGRTKVDGLSEDEILADLAMLRGVDTAPDPAPVAETEVPATKGKSTK